METKAQAAAGCSMSVVQLQQPVSWLLPRLLLQMKAALAALAGSRRGTPPPPPPPTPPTTSPSHALLFPTWLSLSPFLCEISRAGRAGAEPLPDPTPPSATQDKAIKRESVCVCAVVASPGQRSEVHHQRQ